MELRYLFSSEFQLVYCEYHDISVSRSRSRSRASSDPDTRLTRERSGSKSTISKHDSLSDSYQDDDVTSRESKSRAKKLSKVDPCNPLSTYERQTHHRKKFLKPSSFVKKEWFKLRGLNQDDKYVTEDDTKQDAWKTHILADKLVKKYGGEVFSDTKVDDGLHSIVESKESNEEKELTKLQKLQGSTVHLALYDLEGFKTKYEKLQNFIDSWVGNPAKENPEFDPASPPSDSNLPFMWSDQQTAMYEQGQELLTELQIDVAEPLLTYPESPLLLSPRLSARGVGRCCKR